MNDLKVVINKRAFSGWKTVQIDQSIEQVSGTFSILATNIYPGEPTKWGVKLGDSCSLFIDDQLVITGYIDDIDIIYDAVDHDIRISGRDVTGDLVDCSFFSSNTEFSNQTVQRLLEFLCEPFSVPVVFHESAADVAEEVVETFVADQCETIFEHITKLTKLKAVVPVSMGDGKLTITRVGTLQSIDSLEVGVNIKRCNFTQSNKDRFSNYWVKGQGGGSDFIQLTDFIQPSAQTTDGKITRFRPLMLFTEDELDNKVAQARVVWEAKRRAARSRRITYVIPNWVQKNGSVWKTNSLVNVKDNLAGIFGTWLIVGLSFTQNIESGTLTKITVAKKGAYDLFETPVEEVETPFDTPGAGDAGVFSHDAFPRNLLTP